MCPGTAKKVVAGAHGPGLAVTWLYLGVRRQPLVGDSYKSLKCPPLSSCKLARGCRGQLGHCRMAAVSRDKTEAGPAEHMLTRRTHSPGSGPGSSHVLRPRTTVWGFLGRSPLEPSGAPRTSARPVSPTRPADTATQGKPTARAGAGRRPSTRPAEAIYSCCVFLLPSTVGKKTKSLLVLGKTRLSLGLLRS